MYQLIFHMKDPTITPVKSTTTTIESGYIIEEHDYIHVNFIHI